MGFKMLLVFSLLLIAKTTFGEIDCEVTPFQNCDKPEQMQSIPREVPEFNDYCVADKLRLKCLKDYQDQCGTRGMFFFQSQQIYEATYNTLNDICQEGTMLNTVTTENLKCLNETFERTNCNAETVEFLESFDLEAREGGEYRPRFSIFCLRNVHLTECALRAIADNCGKLAGEAALEVVQRSNSLGNTCSVRAAQSVLDDIENLGLDGDKKQSLTRLLQKVVEDNDDEMRFNGY